MSIIKPLNNRLVVEPITDTISKGGIIIPGKKTDKPNKGLVVAEDIDVTKHTLMGRVIYFNAYTAIKLEEDSKELIVKYEDIYASLD